MTTKTASTTLLRRAVRRLGVGLAIAFLALLVLGGAGVASVVAASPPRVGPIANDVDRDIADLVGTSPEDALTHLPAGFESAMGYRPVLQDSRPVNPAGSCSSPVSLPTSFEPACRAHDFGYDLLRFGTKTGHPASPWARRALDAMLVDAMHDSCTDPLCEAAATVADGGLTVNSWRQQWRAPERESTSDLLSTATLRVVESVGTKP
ncbi:hypothetical protein L5G32_14035 [Gordonia sp. HY002]|uniref:hypothetical protein n=1 Tax=Gordonia zhenghanii TaxID=2911516 RepID=UPI001EEFC4D7|nr:hypothetical protein [Gordonia zhenghanii]MCF8571387.1 hypothetical protein [Gordonia zhenghanii]MCF8604899.1 hypothetical protein [Gordonia zhenghanii]